MQKLTIETGNALTLAGPEAWQQLVVTGQFAAKRIDLSRRSDYQATPPGIVRIDASGLVSIRATNKKKSKHYSTPQVQAASAAKKAAAAKKKK